MEKKEFEWSWAPAGASCVNVVRKQWTMYWSIFLYLRLSGMNYYNYFWNKQMGSVKFGWLSFSNGYLINMKKLSRFFLALWLSKNSMIFQGIELNTAQATHKIWASFKGSWKPLKEKSQRILEKPNLALIMKKLWVSTIKLVKDIQECAWQGPFFLIYILISLEISNIKI